MIMIKDEDLGRIEDLLTRLSKMGQMWGFVVQDAENCLAKIREARKGYVNADRN
jgi:hypothetical protein